MAGSAGDFVTHACINHCTFEDAAFRRTIRIGGAAL